MTSIDEELFAVTHLSPRINFSRLKISQNSESFFHAEGPFLAVILIDISDHDNIAIGTSCFINILIYFGKKWSRLVFGDRENDQFTLRNYELNANYFNMTIQSFQGAW